MVLAVLIRLVVGPDSSQLTLRLLALAALFLYYALTEYFFQRTLGKLLTKTIVVDQDDEIPDLSSILLRTVCRFLPLEPLSLLISGKQLAWHDKLSGTKVVFLNY